MRLTFIYKISCLLLLCLCLSFLAEAQFTLKGEIRPRAELRDGFKTLNTQSSTPAFFIEQRSRLSMAYQNEKLGFQFTLQDVRIWGNAAQIYKNDPALTNLYEAWGEYRFSTNTTLRVGRQALDYDNARFLGDLDWAQQGRSHDAVRLIYTDSAEFAFHAGAAFNQQVPFEPGQLAGTFYEGVDNYKTMQYVWFHKDWASAKASWLIFNDGRQRPDSTVAFRQTYGFIGEKKWGTVSLGSELYYQGGKDPAGKSVSAWLAAVNVTFPTAIAPITAGVDYVSGTNPEDTDNKAFNPLYGTNHKFYGFMDYFYVGNNHGQNGNTAGLIDYYIQSKFKLGAKAALITHLHHFQSPTKIYAQEGSGETSGETLSSVLGEEIDLVYNLNLNDEVNFKLGYSHLFSTQSLEALKGKDRQGINHWAWAMLTFQPTLFTK